MALSETAQLLVSLRLQDELTGGLTKAKGELATLESQATSTSSKVGSAFKGMGTAITAGLAAFAGFKVAEFLGGAVEAARQEEASIARLTASLKANVEAWDGNVQAIEAHIEANTKAAFSDDELRQSLGSLVAATHDVTQAFEDQQIAIDLARFTGKSLEEATQTIIAVEAGRFRGLAALGISIKGVTTAEEALAKIRETVAGQGSAFLATDAGKAANLKVAIDELSESFGHFASGPLADASVALANFFDILSGRAQAGFEQQGKDIAAQTAEFVKKATVAQLQGARAGLVAELEHLKSAVNIPGIGDLPIGLGNIGGAADAATNSIKAIDLALANLDGSFNDNTDRMKTAAGAGASLRLAYEGVDGVAHGLANSIPTATDAIDTLGTSIRNLPDSKTINIDVHTTFTGGRPGALDAFESGAPSATTLGAGPGGLTTQDVVAAKAAQTLKEEQDKAAAAAKAHTAALSAQAEALRKVKAAAEDLARANAEKVSNSYDKAKRASDFLFDALHDRHLKAIHDAEALAQKQHDNAVDQIEDALKVAKAQNALAANQAQQQQDSISRARTLRDLRENLADSLAALSKNPNDVGAQRGVRGAREALADFNAQQNIAALQSVQAAKDKAAEAAAQLARDQADADLEAAKLKATAAEQLANKADAKQKQQFNLALEALKKKDIGDPAKFLVDVKALQAKFGIFSDERGFQHIGDVVAGALKNVVLPTPHITLNTQPSFILKLGPVELKGIAAAVASTANPSQAGSARTGQSTPRPT